MNTNFCRHWIDKNCLPWTKDYFQREIINTTFENEEFKFYIDNIQSVTGDCDVTQRKGKVLCIYDMKVELSAKGCLKNEESEDLSINISLPEFVHDQDEDEYVFEITSDNYKAEIRKFFIPVLKQKLMQFQGDLISAHEKDVQHATD